MYSHQNEFIERNESRSRENVKKFQISESVKIASFYSFHKIDKDKREREKERGKSRVNSIVSLIKVANREIGSERNTNRVELSKERTKLKEREDNKTTQKFFFANIFLQLFDNEKKT